MKKEVHPKYRQVLFVDSSTGHKFVCGSTLPTQETETHEGKSYPVYRASISSSSHPFFTGSKGLVDAEGRIDKFKKRYIMVQTKREGEEKEEKRDEKKEEKGKKESRKKAS